MFVKKLLRFLNPSQGNLKGSRGLEDEDQELQSLEEIEDKKLKYDKKILSQKSKITKLDLSWFDGIQNSSDKVVSDEDVNYLRSKHKSKRQKEYETRNLKY